MAHKKFYNVHYMLTTKINIRISKHSINNNINKIQKNINLIKEIGSPTICHEYNEAKLILKYFLEIANSMLQLAKNDINNYHKAVAIYQYCDSFSKNVRDPSVSYDDNPHVFDQDIFEDYNLKSYEVTVNFLKNHSFTRTSIDFVQWKIDVYKEHLKTLRSNITTMVNNKQEISVINETIYLSMKTLVKDLIDYCIDLLQTFPEGCEYAILGLGSFSKKTITPWSDFEFAILLNDNRYKEYFRKLSYLLYITIIQIGETPLFKIGIDFFNNYKSHKQSDNWFEDNLIKSGFSLDGSNHSACKLPLGRKGYKVIENNILKAKPDYELICAIDELARFQKETPSENEDLKTYNNWFDSDRFLVQSLRSVALICGSANSQNLVNNYRTIIKDIIKPIILQKRSLYILKKDLEKFNLSWNVFNNEEIFSVKKDIYRLPERIINALADYFNILPSDGEDGDDIFNIINKMYGNNHISEYLAESFKAAISIAVKLRLMTYSHNGFQTENLSIYYPEVEDLWMGAQMKFEQHTFCLLNKNILEEFYHEIVKICKVMDEFCNNQNFTLSSNNNIYILNFYDKALIEAKLMLYNNAIKNIQLAITKHPENVDYKLFSYKLYLKIGAPSSANNLANEIFAKHGLYIQDPLYQITDLSELYKRFGKIYQENNKYSNAEYFYKKSLALNKNDKSLFNAEIYTNLAKMYSKIGDNKNALLNFYDAFMEYELLYGDNPNTRSKATCYLEAADHFFKINDLSASKEYYEKALLILNAIYQDAFHPDILKINYRLFRINSKKIKKIHTDIKNIPLSNEYIEVDNSFNKIYHYYSSDSILNRNLLNSISSSLNCLKIYIKKLSNDLEEEKKLQKEYELELMNAVSYILNERTIYSNQDYDLESFDTGCNLLELGEYA